MRGGRIDLESLVGALVLGGVAFFVLYPILLIVLNSFQVARPGAAAQSGVDHGGDQVIRRQNVNVGIFYISTVTI